MFRHLFICLLSILVFTEAGRFGGSKPVVEQEQKVNNNGGPQGIQGVDEFQNDVRELQKEITKMQGLYYEKFKKELYDGALGADGGILTYESGKATIKSATEPFIHNGRNYNWDNHGKVGSDELQCSMPLSQWAEEETSNPTTASPDESIVVPSTPSPDQVLQNIQYQDGSRPEKIVWSCKKENEVCCGTDCCPTVKRVVEVAGFIAMALIIFWACIPFILILIVLLLCCACGIGLYFCCRAICNCGDDKQYRVNHSQPGQYQMQQENSKSGIYNPPQGIYPSV